MTKIHKTRPPQGYRWEGDTLVVIPEQAEVCRQIYELFIIYRRKGTVARLINEMGYRTDTNHKFGYSTIKSIISRSVYKGEFKARLIKPDSLGNNYTSLSVPAVVSEQTWDQANRILSAQKDNPNSKISKDPFLGKIKCYCGQLMIIPSKSKRYQCDACQLHISTADVHALFAEAIKPIPFPNHQSLKNANPDHSLETVLPNTLGDYWEKADKNKRLLFIDTVLDHISVDRNSASICLYPLFNFATVGTERG